MDPNFGFSSMNCAVFFYQVQQDYDLVSASLAKGDLTELRQLLDRKASFSGEHFKSIWAKFPDLAVEYLDVCPKLAAHCPLGFLEQQQDNPTLIAKLFDLGLLISEEEYVSLSIRYPRIVSKVLESRPNFAKECPVRVFEMLEAFPQTERVRKVIEKSGAKTYRDDVPDTGMAQDVDEVARSFKKTRMAEGSDEELPDIENYDSE